MLCARCFLQRLRLAVRDQCGRDHRGLPRRCRQWASLPMPGGWSMSMMWMPMCGQTWPRVAASFVGMRIAMMTAMMLPSVAPVLWRYREALCSVTHARAAMLSMVDLARRHRLFLPYGLHWARWCSRSARPSRTLQSASAGALACCARYSRCDGACSQARCNPPHGRRIISTAANSHRNAATLHCRCVPMPRYDTACVSGFIAAMLLRELHGGTRRDRRDGSSGDGRALLWRSRSSASRRVVRLSCEALGSQSSARVC